jgi:hypothetical protein
VTGILIKYVEDDFINKPQYNYYNATTQNSHLVKNLKMHPPRHLLIVRVGLSNGLHSPTYCDEECIQNMFWNNQLNIADFINDGSNGRIQFSRLGSLIQSINIQSSHLICDPFKWATESLAYISNHDSYDYVIFLLPKTSNCNWLGLAFSPCYFTSMCYSFTRSEEPMVIIHEIGHNFGMFHASIDRNNDGIIDSEYGDFSSPMSNSFNWKRYSAINMLTLDSIKNLMRTNIPINDEIQSYILSTTSFNLYDDNTFQTISAMDTITGIKYWLSFRSKVNFPSYDFGLSEEYINKLLIHKWVNGGRETILVGTLRPGEHFLNKRIIFSEIVDSNYARIFISNGNHGIFPTLSNSRTRSPSNSKTKSSSSRFSSRYSNTRSISPTKTRNYSYSNTRSISSTKTRNYSYSNTRSISSTKTRNYSYSNTRSISPTKTRNYSYSNTRSISPTK